MKIDKSVKLPGFLNSTGLLLAAAALVIVVIIILVGGGHIFSPGPLSANNLNGTTLGGVTSHAELGANCAACHAPPLSSQNMDARCLTCHTEIQAELQVANTLHGMVKGTNCRDCHTEHRGPEGDLTEIARIEIDHNQFGFSLASHQTTSDNQPFQCEDCHTERLTKFEPALCETCHRQIDEPFMAAHMSEFGSDCRACHNGEDIFSADRFDHNLLAFPLLGKHAEVQCVDCHQGVKSLTGFKEAPVDCVGCHITDNIHPIEYGTECARCHNSESWQTEIFDHNLSVFKLTGKHMEVPCAECHINRVYKGTPTTCVSCHAQDDVHLGRFGTECAACHTTETWQRGAFEHTFPLDHGGRGTIACATCHTLPDNYQAYTCSNCHDPEEIRQVHVFAEMMNTNITDCARCHPTGQITAIMH